MPVSQLLAAVVMGSALAAEPVELLLGIVGGVTKKTYQFHALVAAWDLDFQKNHDEAVRARLGPPVVEVEALPPQLRIRPILANTNGVAEISIGAALDLILGRRNYSKIHGLAGAYYSSVSMPTASLCATLKQPQVSWGSTNPSLSNKQVYPFFLRTIPPDSIQARAMWRYMNVYGFAKAGVIYSAEPYGQGVFEALTSLAQGAGRGYAVEGRSLPFMVKDFDSDRARDTTTATKGMGTKFIITVLTSNLWPQFAPIWHEEMSTEYQMLGSESMVGNEFISSLYPGTHAVTPVSKGRLYPRFWELWSKLTENDYAGAAHLERWMISSWNAEGGIFNKSRIEANWFVEPSTLNFMNLFMFDALYTYAQAFSKLVGEGVEPEQIRGEKLLETLRGISFEGVTGKVSFDANGDRLADYDMHHVIGEGDGKTWSRVGTYSASSDTLNVDDPAELLWMTGGKGEKAPGSLTECPAGFFPDTRGICQQCLEGTYANRSGVEDCAICGAGTYSNEDRTGCNECPTGSFAVAARPACTLCSPGLFQDSIGSSGCERCPVGHFSRNEGQTICLSCGANASQEGVWRTTYLGATDASACVCPQGMYLSLQGSCENCADGVSCAEGSSEADLTKRCDGGDYSSLIYPKPANRYYTTCSDNPLRAYMCLDDTFCTGEDVDHCTGGRQGLACGRCNEGWYEDGLDCKRCSDVEQSRFLWPTLPSILGPLCIVVLYLASRDTIEKWMSPGNNMAALLFLTLVYFQTIASHNTLNVQWPNIMQASAGWTKYSWELLSLFRPTCAFGDDFVATFVMSLLLPLYVMVVFLVVYLVSLAVSLVDARFKMNRDILQSCYFALYNTFFIGIASQTFALFQCYDHPNGKSSLRSRPDIICSASPWQDVVVLGIIGILFFCGGALALFSYIVWIAPDNFKEEGFRMRWKFLFLRFRPSVYYWALVMLLKGLWIILPTVCFSEAPAQIAFLSVGTIVYLLWTSVQFPWRCFMVGAMDALMHGDLAFLLTFLPYLAIMPNEQRMTEIEDEYTVFTYLPIVAVVVGVIWQLYLRLNPPDDAEKYQQHATEICEIFSRLSRVDTQQMGSVLKQLPWADVTLLFTTRRLLVDEVLAAKTPGGTGKNALMYGKRLRTRRLSQTMETKSDLGRASPAECTEPPTEEQMVPETVSPTSPAECTEPQTEKQTVPEMVVFINQPVDSYLVTHPEEPPLMLVGDTECRC